MDKKIEGIVIRSTSYGETSKIINIVTRDGIVGIMAKGAKKLKSPIRGGTELLTHSIFNLYYKKDKLSILKSTSSLNNFPRIRSDITKISYATYLAELVSQILKEGFDEEIYNIFLTSLVKIEEGLDPMIITNIFELKVLEFLGVKPVLDSCVICGKQDNIITISSHKGGYLCKECITPSEEIVKPEVIKLIRMFYYVDIDKIAKLSIKPNIKKEINNFIDDYYDRYTGLYLKSKRFIETLAKI